MTIFKALAALAAFTLLSPLHAAQKDDKVRAVRGDLTLHRAVELAVKQNPDILRAIQEIERTRGLVIEVRAQALPQVNLTTNYTQQDKDLLERRSSSGGGGSSIDLSDFGAGSGTIDLGGGGGGSDNTGGDKSWRVAIEARQVIYSGGQVKAALKIAKYTEDQSLYLLRETVDRVIAQARTQFYAVLLNRKLITVAEQNILLLEAELRDQKLQFDAGTVARFNVLRAEVAVANAQPDLVRARNNYVIAQLELAKTLGLNASYSQTQPDFNVVGTLRMTERELHLGKALTMAMQRRGFLKAQKQNILTEEQQIIVAKAGYKPRIDASGGYEMRNSRLTDNLSKEANGWFFGIDGSWAIFDGFETKGKVIQANARLASARTTYEDSVRQVELEVQRALNSVREARQLIISQGRAVEQAEEALRLVRSRIEAGAGRQLEFLDAQVALDTARTTQQQVLYEYNAALAELDRATGADTGYDDTLPDPALNKAKKQLRTGTPELRDK